MVMDEIRDQLSDQEENETGEPKNIVFNVEALHHACKESEDPNKYITTSVPYKMSFKLVKSDSRLVKSMLFSYGFVQCSPRNSNFNLCWSNIHLNSHSMRILKPWQRVNHFPRSFMITKKDQLYIQLNRAKVHYGVGFDFIPESFCTPISVEKRERIRRSLQPSDNSNKALYIVKPANSSRGRGIQFLNEPEQLDEIKDCDQLVISRYIDNPYLIQNKKCDLRIYVAVTSFYPLIAYQFTDGLTRFAVDDYSNDPTGVSQEAQLTNYSLHKSNDKFVKNMRVDCEDIGNKWTLGALLRIMEKSGVDTKLLMVRIEDLVVKTLLSVQRVIGASCRKLNLSPNNCFELFGFDILIDAELKPWILEVNLSPSLNCDAPVDSIIKSDLVASTLNLARIPLVVERNTLNKAYVLSKRSSSVDDISTAVSSTSVAVITDGKVQSASASPSTVDSGYDTLSTSSGNRNAYRRISPPRRTTSLKAVKQRRACHHTKMLSPEKIIEYYHSKLNMLAEKVRGEEELVGNFIRIFPRPESKAIYNSICEDSGAERWDEGLSEMLFGKSSLEATQRDYEKFHEEMMDARKYGSTELLSDSTKRMLQTAFETVEKYLEPFYEDDPNPFPQFLPKLRFGLRKRTLSAIDFDLKRRAEVIAKRETTNVDDYLELKQFLYENYKTSEGTPRLVS